MSIPDGDDVILKDRMYDLDRDSIPNESCASEKYTRLGESFQQTRTPDRGGFLDCRGSQPRGSRMGPQISASAQ